MKYERRICHCFADFHKASSLITACRRLWRDNIDYVTNYIDTLDHSETCLVQISVQIYNLVMTSCCFLTSTETAKLYILFRDLVKIDTFSKVSSN